MKYPTKFRSRQVLMLRQRGVVLFLALVAMLAMSLAAVALIRSVDTGTMIAGNLAFKQSATASADNGVEQAIVWMLANSGGDMATDPVHPFNTTNLPMKPGYYSNASVDLFADATWTGDASISIGTDGSGNTTRYVIERMCRTADALPAFTEDAAASKTSCLFFAQEETLEEMKIKTAQEYCSDCVPAGQTPAFRITSRTNGPRNTVSYVQAFAY